MSSSTPVAECHLLHSRFDSVLDELLHLARPEPGVDYFTGIGPISVSICAAALPAQSEVCALKTKSARVISEVDRRAARIDTLRSQSVGDLSSKHRIKKSRALKKRVNRAVCRHEFKILRDQISIQTLVQRAGSIRNTAKAQQTPVHCVGEAPSMQTLVLATKVQSVVGSVFAAIRHSQAAPVRSLVGRVTYETATPAIVEVD